MKLRLPIPFRRGELVPELGITDPGPAFRIIEPPQEVESVRRIPAEPGSPGGLGERSEPRTPPPPPLEAGYRWGMAAARIPCGLSAHADRSEPAGLVEVLPALAGDHLPAVRFERAVLAVAARTEVLAAAVERIRDHLGEVDDRFVDVVTHEEVVEIESRRARLAAEMARLSVELKAEMDRRLSELGRAMAEQGGRAPRVENRGTLDLADAKRVEVHLDRLAEAEHVTDLTDVTDVTDVTDLTDARRSA